MRGESVGMGVGSSFSEGAGAARGSSMFEEGREKGRGLKKEKGEKMEVGGRRAKGGVVGWTESSSRLRYQSFVDISRDWTF